MTQISLGALAIIQIFGIQRKAPTGPLKQKQSTSLINMNKRGPKPGERSFLSITIAELTSKFPPEQTINVRRKDLFPVVRKKKTSSLAIV